MPDKPLLRGVGRSDDLVDTVVVKVGVLRDPIPDISPRQAFYVVGVAIV